MATIKTVKMTQIELEGSVITLPFDANLKEAGEAVKARIVFETVDGEKSMPVEIVEFRQLNKKIAKVIIKTEA